MDRLLLGDTNPDGTSNPSNGWKQYGLDIDGLVSAKDSVGLCKPKPGYSPAVVYPDGNDGKDNAFGRNVLAILTSLDAGVSASTQQKITDGGFTYLLAIEGLGASTSCAPAASKLSRGLNLGAPPKFDGSDVWPLDPTLLADPADPASAKNVFLQSSVDNDLFRSGLEADFTVFIDVSGYPLPLKIHHARIEMQLQPGHGGAVSGQIAGILDTEELAQGVALALAAFDQSFCDENSPTLQSVLQEVRGASDILEDGTQDPAKECNGISIGLGFTMKTAKLGQAGPPENPPPDPCHLP
jgi:hypothetical protein